MNADDLIWRLLILPFGLGLLGFIEPCSIGSSMLFIKAVEGRGVATKVLQAIVFTLTRALFIGILGAMAALVGMAFLTLQKLGWIVLGGLYMTVGVIYLTGRSATLARTIGPRLSRQTSLRGAAGLAVLFGLNIPACAAPLLAAVLGSAVLGGAAGIGLGFVSLTVFGLALSLPLTVALLWEPARRALDRLASLSSRVPTIIGIVFIAVGTWSIYLGVRYG